MTPRTLLLALSLVAAPVLAGERGEVRLALRPKGLAPGASLDPPKTPPGLPVCRSPMVAPTDLPRATGETVRYVVDVDGLSVGTIDFQITRDGAFEGHQVTEYRSLFKLDALVATLIPVDGRAASLVPHLSSAPLRAMNRYQSGKAKLEEEVTYADAGRALLSVRKKNGAEKNEQRRFLGPAYDFVSGFYVLRSLPREMQGCTIIYGDQRAYTVWIEPSGTESVKTPVGYQPADRYAIRFGSERSKATRNAILWVAQTEDRLPYRVQIDGPHPLEARVHLYEKGKP